MNVQKLLFVADRVSTWAGKLSAWLIIALMLAWNGPLYPVNYRSGNRRSFAERAFQLPPTGSGKARGGDRALCVAQVNTPTGRGPSYVTECPPVMQKALRAR